MRISDWSSDVCSSDLLARTEGDDTACGDRDLFAGLGISTGTLVFGAQFEIAETGQFDLFASFQASADFFEKKIDELLGLALVEPEIFEQCFGQLGLGQCHRTLPLSVTAESRPVVHARVLA